jgi:AcrR family transcriptional regulator
VADENSGTDPVVDLFGQPVKTTQRGRGRPAHKRTRETVNRVILGLARGWTVAEVAQSIGITIPTLRLHYSSELRRRRAMCLMMESVQLGRLNDQAEKGNVAAEKELMKALEKGRIRQLSTEVAHGANRAPRVEKLGKKERAAEAARNVGGRYGRRNPPPQPSLLRPSGNA